MPMMRVGVLSIGMTRRRRFLSAEVAAPRRVREDADVFGVRPRVRNVEAAAQRRDAQHGHELRGHEGGIDPPRAFGRAEVDRALAVAADILERPVVFLELGPFGERHPEAVEAQPRKRAGDERQPLGLRVAQGLEHHAVDDAEDRGVAPMRWRGQDCDRGIPGLSRASEGVGDVLLRVFISCIPRISFDST